MQQAKNQQKYVETFWTSSLRSLLYLQGFQATETSCYITISALPCKTEIEKCHNWHLKQGDFKCLEMLMCVAYAQMAWKYANSSLLNPQNIL